MELLVSLVPGVIKRHCIIIVFLLLSSIAYSENLNGIYIYDIPYSWNLEVISLQKIGDSYLFLYDTPTHDGIDAYSAYEIGIWDGEQIVFDNGFSIYGLKPQPDGTLHYYAIKDTNEFPGKNFRLITEEDLVKITELK